MAFIEALSLGSLPDDAPYPAANYDRIVASGLGRRCATAGVWFFPRRPNGSTGCSSTRSTTTSRRPEQEQGHGQGNAAGRVLDEIAAALADDDFTDRDRLESTVMGIGQPPLGGARGEGDVAGPPEDRSHRQRRRASHCGKQ